VPFQPELAFEGVEGALDPLPEAAQRPMLARLVSAVRTQQPGAMRGDQLLELLPGKALVAQDEQSRAQPLALTVEYGGDDFTFAQLRRGQAQATGSPSGAASRYSRNPQK
jgi:hypothetical protein